MIERVRDLDGVGKAIAVVVALIALVGGLLVVTSASDEGDDRVDTAASSTTERTTTTTAERSTTTSTSTTALDGAPAGGSTTSTTTAPGRTGTGRSTATTAKPGPGGSGGGTGGGATTTTRGPVTTVTTPPPPQPSGSCTGATRGDESDRLATLFCNDRVANGKPKMVRTSALNQMAQEWANKIAADHALSHRASADMRARTLAACSACNGWAENVAFIQPVNPDGLWQNWLASPTHLGNIRDGHAGEYGMAIAKLPDGSLWAVQNFGRYP